MNKQIYQKLLDYGPVLVVGDGIFDVYITTKDEKPVSESVGASAQLKCFDSNAEIGFGGAGNVYENILEFGGFAEDFCPIVDYKFRIGDGDCWWGRFDVKVDDFNLSSSIGPTRKSDDVILAELETLLADRWFGGLVIADYAKGVVTRPIVELLSRYNFKNVLIDTKRPPQEVFGPIIANFGNSCAFLPNRQEYNQYLLEYQQLPVVIRTESEDGVTLIQNGKEVLHVDAVVKPHEVVGVSGAGDTVTAACAVGLATGAKIDKILEFAMHAAGYVVKQSRLSTVPGGEKLVERFLHIS